jgi:hypothetical protein
MSQASLSKTLAPHDAALPERPRKRKPFLTSERGLGLAGVVLAAASGSFAAYMISDTTRQPRISGAEYFSVFAKLTPSGKGNPTGPTRPQLPESEADELKTASIAPKETPRPGPAVAAKAVAALPDPFAFAPSSVPTVREYVLRSVTRGVALVDSAQGLREVRPGTVLPFAGLVTSIEQRDGRWIVVTARGVIREARR